MSLSVLLNLIIILFQIVNKMSINRLIPHSKINQNLKKL